MQLIKSLSDGIGTAAGVAWPTFGILFGTLGLAIGGTVALILGSFCIGIFAFVIGSVTYWAYQQYHKDQKLTKLNALNQKNNFANLLTKYFFTIMKKYLLDNNLKEIKNIDVDILTAYIKTQINQDLSQSSKISPLLIRCLSDLVAEENIPILSKFIETYKGKINLNKNLLPKEKENFFQNHENIFIKNVTYSSSYSAQIKSGMIGFFAAFGSIAGCAAGTYGLLVGMGIFAGLAAVPIAGWAALGAAVIFGGIIAGICAYWSYTANKKCSFITQFDQANHNLELLQHTRNTEIEVEIKIQKKYQLKKEDDAIKNGHKKEFRNTLKKSHSFELGRLYKNHSIWNANIESPTPTLTFSRKIPTSPP